MIPASSKHSLNWLALEVGAEASPANRRPGASQEPQPADHVAEDRDDLRRAGAALGGCLVGLLVGREGVLELLQVDGGAGAMPEQRLASRRRIPQDS